MADAFPEEKTYPEEETFPAAEVTVRFEDKIVILAHSYSRNLPHNLNDRDREMIKTLLNIALKELEPRPVPPF